MRLGRLSSVLATLALACADNAAPLDDGAIPAPDGPSDIADAAPPALPDAAPALHGTPPAAPVPLPSFAAVNRDGSARGPGDLLGHPTVMWFYPSAATAG